MKIEEKWFEDDMKWHGIDIIIEQNWHENDKKLTQIKIRIIKFTQKWCRKTWIRHENDMKMNLK